MTRAELLNIAKPILFNTEMVKAILEGRKTVTRRVVKRKGYNEEIHNSRNDYAYERGDKVWSIGYRAIYRSYPQNAVGVVQPYCPVDILYVRETWYEDAYRIMYKADYSESEKFYQNGKEILVKWKPSIHMPKEAARIFLRVTDVRVERLQDIDGKQIFSEGVDNGKSNPAMGARWENMQRIAFKDLWDSTIKKSDLATYGWSANPWIWVIEFERCEKPENFLAEIGKE